MPQITINYTVKNLSDGSLKYATLDRSDACFRMLGKNKDYTRDLYIKLMGKFSVSGYELESVDSLALWDTSDVTDEEVQRLRNIFSFMRVISEERQDGYLVFDLNFPLNEVMHALFWIRALYTEGQLYDVYSRVYSETKNEHSSLLLSCISKNYAISKDTSGAIFTESKPFQLNNIVEGDGTVLVLDQLTPLRYVQIMTGDYQRRSFAPKTLTEILEERGSYAKNLSRYGHTKGTCTNRGKAKRGEPTALDLATDIVIASVVKSGVSVPTRVISNLGQVVNRNSYLSPMKVQNILIEHGASVIVPVLRKYGIPEELIKKLESR